MSSIERFIIKMKQFLSEKHLPGHKAQAKMAPLLRSSSLKLYDDQKHAIQSSVLILLFPVQQSLKTVLILRPVYNGIHSGQISFPGGKAEKHDRSFIDTALREANEEIGIEKELEILGTLTELFIPPSNYLVKPVIAFDKQVPEFKIDTFEVDELILINLNDLLNPETLKHNEFFNVGRGESVKAPCFLVNNNHRIWGATAMIISELIEILRLIDFEKYGID